MKQTFVLQPSPHPARQNAIRALQLAPDGQVVEIKDPSRTLTQNAAQWPILQAWSEQKVWHVNGKPERLTPEDWKDLLTASFDGEMARISQTLDGRMVLLGRRTSKFSAKRFSAWLDFLHAASIEHGITLDPAIEQEPIGRTA